MVVVHFNTYGSRFPTFVGFFVNTLRAEVPTVFGHFQGAASTAPHAHVKNTAGDHHLEEIEIPSLEKIYIAKGVQLPRHRCRHGVAIAS